MEVLILTYGPRVGVDKDKEGMAAGNQSWEITSKLQTQSRECELEVGWGYKFSKPTPVMCLLQQGYTEGSFLNLPN